MQIALNTPAAFQSGVAAPAMMGGLHSASPGSLTQYQIIRRNGAVVPFEPAKIAVAMMKAFLAVHGTQGAASASVREVVDGLTQTVVRALMMGTCDFALSNNPQCGVVKNNLAVGEADVDNCNASRF